MIRQNELLNDAAHNHKVTTKRGLLERAFTSVFKGFVYPQIWEDPEVDMQALQLSADSRLVTIASGGCNVLNYLTEAPAAIHAIDLNTHHVHLTRLKLAAVRHLPDYETFFQFFGHAEHAENTRSFDRLLATRLPTDTRAHWEQRRVAFMFGRRINYFKKNIYEYGLLGRVITAGHWIARLHGKDPKKILTATSLEEQRRLFDEIFAPLFDRRMVNALFKMPVSLYGLGIPPAQYHALSGGGNMAGVLRERLERLACDFPIHENYFAWQAFGRGYDREARRTLPRYLEAHNHDAIRAHADRVTVTQASYTDFLRTQDDASLDRYILLDAQDWMNDQQLTELWSEILRTAKPGSRIIFRTAGTDSPLEGAVPDEILSKFETDPQANAQFLARDRSAVYGGFHLYVLR